MSVAERDEQRALTDVAARCMLALESLRMRSALEPKVCALAHDEVVLRAADVELMLRAAMWRSGYLIGRNGA